MTLAAVTEAYRGFNDAMCGMPMRGDSRHYVEGYQRGRAVRDGAK